MAYWDKDNEFSIIQLRRTKLSLNNESHKEKLSKHALKFGEPVFIPSNHYLIVANADNQSVVSNQYRFKEYKSNIIDCSVFFDANSRETIDSKNKDVVQLIDDTEKKIYCAGRAKDITYNNINVQQALDDIHGITYAKADYKGGNALGIKTETPKSENVDYFVTGVRPYTQGKINILYNAQLAKTAENDIAPYGVRFNAKTGVLKGAAWNDYAEYRIGFDGEPGRCVYEYGDGSVHRTTERLQPGASIVSDTYGMVIGETADANTPIALSGRTLAYTYEDRNLYVVGDAVCSGPDGTISKMTREEIKEYPDRIIGIVSEIPDYEYWGQFATKVNGRIWIKIK